MPGLSSDRIKVSVSAYQSARGTSQNTPQITYARSSRASARRTGEASQSLEPVSQAAPNLSTRPWHYTKYVPHPLTAWERATAVDASPAGMPGRYATIRCLGNVATLAAPDAA